MKRIDHVLIRVDDLHEGVAEFKDAGFEVFYGTHPSKAYNALIYLEDYSFLELLGTDAIPWYFRELTRLGIIRLLHTFYNRMGNYALKEGPLLDYVIYSDDIHSLHSRVRREATPMIAGKREKPNGLTVSWHCFAPKDLNMPFLISDYDPEKVSADETKVQPNGITGIRNLDVAFEGDQVALKQRLIHFYGIENRCLSENGRNFSVQTENAKINFTQLNQNKVRGMTLKPYNPIIDEKLGRYGLTSADDAADSHG